MFWLDNIKRSIECLMFIINNMCNQCTQHHYVKVWFKIKVCLLVCLANWENLDIWEVCNIC